MYIPRPFMVDDATARNLLSQVTVGQLVTATEHGPLATLVPWVYEEASDTLISHMARPNAQWQTPWLGQALVIAHGPHGYVSASWYASKAEHGRVVPTWDYLVLQVYGQLVVHDDPAWVFDAVRRLTDKHEQPRPDPWAVDDAPSEYIEGLLKVIVGVEVRIDRIEAALKMSQNKSAADAAGVIDGFLADGNEVVAEWVRQSTSGSPL
jgi:transcriptional regulator